MLGMQLMRVRQAFSDYILVLMLLMKNLLLLLLLLVSGCLIVRVPIIVALL